MRVLSVHMGCDTAGIGWLLTQAFKDDLTVKLRSAVSKTNFIDYPRDITDWSEAEREWQRAHVVHVHNAFGTWRRMGIGKPFVMHHHGTFYRNHHEEMNRAIAEHGGRAVVATLDLLDYGGDPVWCPAPFDLDWLATFRKPRQGRIRVGHSPTDRSLKHTEAFLAACEKLDVEPVLTEHKPWSECLAIKGTVDIFYDQVLFGYGHNAIEAWGMGIPVIAGGSDALLTRMRDTFGSLPFVEATESTIGDAIESLLDDDTRTAYGNLGRKHVKRWHDGTETRRILTRLYSELA